jgi:hypothetical protein
MPKVVHAHQSREGFPLVLIIVLAAVVAAGAAVGGYFLFRSTPEKAVAEFLAAARDGDVSRARAVLTPSTTHIMDQVQQQASQAFGSQILGALATRAAASMILQVVPETLLAADVKEGQATITGDIATVPLIVANQIGDASSNPPAPFLKCQKVGWQWKVDLSEQLASVPTILPTVMGALRNAPGPTGPSPASPAPGSSPPSSSGGSLSVTGKVVDAGTLAPVSGASVAAQGQTATTGSDGSFALASLSSNPVSLTVQATGYQPHTASAQVADAGTIPLEPVHTAGLGTVTGSVSAKGAPVAGATLTLSAWQAKTDAQGNFGFFNIPPGTWAVSVTGADPSLTASVQVKVTADSTVSVGTIQLGGGVAPATGG